MLTGTVNLSGASQPLPVNRGKRPSKVGTLIALNCAPQIFHFVKTTDMTQNYNRGGRPHKINPAVFRYVVRLDAKENEVFISMFEKTQALNKAAFIKGVLFNTPFKVFYMDENTRVFIDKLSSLNALYRTVGVEYALIVKTLRENFNERKAMKALYNLEQKTTELVRISMEIVSLARQFDEAWSQKSR